MIELRNKTEIKLFLEENIHFALKVMAKVKEMKMQDYASKLLTSKIEEFADDILSLKNYKSFVNKESKKEDDHTDGN